MKKRYRSEKDKLFAGVCGGIAEYLEVDTTLVRLGFAAFSIMCGSGILAYIVAAIVIPGKEI